MSEQGQEKGQESVYEDFFGFLGSIGEELWQSIEGLPVSETIAVDQGTNPRADLSLRTQ